MISYGRGCIPGMMGSATSWSIPPASDFVAPAVRQIEGWIDDPASYASPVALLRERFDSIDGRGSSVVGRFRALDLR